jgi:hypothetical protein
LIIIIGNFPLIVVLLTQFMLEALTDAFARAKPAQLDLGERLGRRFCLLEVNISINILAMPRCKRCAG